MADQSADQNGAGLQTGGYDAEMWASELERSAGLPPLKTRPSTPVAASTSVPLLPSKAAASPPPPQTPATKVAAPATTAPPAAIAAQTTATDEPGAKALAKSIHDLAADVGLTQGAWSDSSRSGAAEHTPEQQAAWESGWAEPTAGTGHSPASPQQTRGDGVAATALLKELLAETLPWVIGIAGVYLTVRVWLAVRKIRNARKARRAKKKRHSRGGGYSSDGSRRRVKSPSPQVARTEDQAV